MAQIEKTKAEDKPKNVLVTAVYGDMVHPWTLTRFTSDAAKPHVEDEWVAMQRDAGKLKTVSV